MNESVISITHGAREWQPQHSRRRIKFELDFLQSIPAEQECKRKSFLKVDLCEAISVDFLFSLPLESRTGGAPGHRFHMAFRDQNRTREHGLFARVSCDHGKNHLPLKIGVCAPTVPYRPASSSTIPPTRSDMPETSC